MKYLTLALVVMSLFLSLSVRAALIDNGEYTYDSGSGLDWLDLSATTSMTYNAAITSRLGWRAATNLEVENLFSVLFDGYYDTSLSGLSESWNNAYTNQQADVLRFQELFGPAYIRPNQELTLGLYIDEDSVLRQIGIRILNVNNSTIYGLEYIGDYIEYKDTIESSAAGTFMVRNSPVPLPSAFWLFGSGLIVLIKFLRKK